MSRSYTYRDIRYELKETQGFFFCLVFAEGDETALFQTKYYASIESATSAAVNFIDDYATYRKTKVEKDRTRTQMETADVVVQDPEQEEEKQGVIPRELLSGKNLIEGTKPKRKDYLLGKSTKTLETKTVPHTSKIWQENGEIRTSVPVVESAPDLRSSLLDYSKTDSRSKEGTERRRPKFRALPVILLAGTALLSISIIVGSASGFFENMLQRDPPPPISLQTDTPEVVVTPTQAEATIGLPQAAPTDTSTPTPETTPTVTSTPTFTATPITLTPTRTPTRTPRPTNTNPPAATNTPAPTATDTGTPTDTSTPVPPTATPTDTPPVAPPTAPWLPTDTPSP